MVSLLVIRDMTQRIRAYTESLNVSALVNEEEGTLCRELRIIYPRTRATNALVRAWSRSEERLRQLQSNLDAVKSTFADAMAKAVKEVRKGAEASSTVA